MVILSQNLLPDWWWNSEHHWTGTLWLAMSQWLYGQENYWEKWDEVHTILKREHVAQRKKAKLRLEDQSLGSELVWGCRFVFQTPAEGRCGSCQPDDICVRGDTGGSLNHPTTRFSEVLKSDRFRCSWWYVEQQCVLWRSQFTITSAIDWISKPKPNLLLLFSLRCPCKRSPLVAFSVAHLRNY